MCLHFLYDPDSVFIVIELGYSYFQVLSHCVPSLKDITETRVSMVTELGVGIDLIMLLQMSWEDRLRVSRVFKVRRNWTYHLSIIQ